MVLDALAHVRLLAVYPVKGEPGRRLEFVDIDAEGLAGDRRKKSAVHLVGEGLTPETMRANIFLDLDDADLRATMGSDLRIGDVVLHVDTQPSHCPGVYASVVTEGRVALADAVHRGDRPRSDDQHG